MFINPELYEIFVEQWRELMEHGKIYCLRPAKNKKGRDVALICYLQENADHTVRYVPVARMIDPLCRANYVIEEIPAKAA